MLLAGIAAFTAIATQPHADPLLSQVAKDALDATLKEYGPKGLKEENIGAGVAVLDTTGKTFRFGSVRGAQPFYPASVVKLFYLAYAADSLAHDRMKITPEFSRGVHDMIVDSVNDATAYVLESMTDATSGAELTDAEMKKWADKRQAVNRWFTGMGYTGVNACNRTWNEGPYGRERVFLGKNFENRNSLTIDACIRLMSEIALGTALRPNLNEADSAKWCDWMNGFLSRHIPADASDADEQSKEFIGGILPKGAKLWSKAGYTDTARHDVAHVLLPNGKELVVVVFTKNSSDLVNVIPAVASRIIAAVGN